MHGILTRGIQGGIKAKDTQINSLRIKLWPIRMVAVFLSFFIYKDSNSTSSIRHMKWWARHLALHILAGIITAIAGAPTLTTASILEPLDCRFYKEQFHVQTVVTVAGSRV